jgi:hypothetical protein
MKTILTAICATALLSASVSLAGTGVTFSVESRVKTVRVGDHISLTLKVEGSDITNIVARATDGAEFLNPGTGAFQYNCDFTAKKEGKCVFGPYVVSFNGQTLSSRPLTVRVLPKWTGEYGTFFRIDQTNITLGEEVELVQETWGQRREEYSATHARMKRPNADFDNSYGPSQNSFSVSKGATNCYNRQTWLLKPKRAGVFKITKELFEELPDGVAPPDFAVTVEEAQPTGARDGVPAAHDP